MYTNMFENTENNYFLGDQIGLCAKIDSAHKLGGLCAKPILPKNININ